MALIHRLVVPGFSLGVTSITSTSAGRVKVYELTITTGAALTRGAEIPLSTLIGMIWAKKREHASESTSQARSPMLKSALLLCRLLVMKRLLERYTGQLIVLS